MTIVMVVGVFRLWRGPSSLRSRQANRGGAGKRVARSERSGPPVPCRSDSSGRSAGSALRERREAELERGVQRVVDTLDVGSGDGDLSALEVGNGRQVGRLLLLDLLDERGTCRHVGRDGLLEDEVVDFL